MEEKKSLTCEDFGKKNCLNCEFFRAGLDGCDIMRKMNNGLLSSK